MFKNSVFILNKFIVLPTFNSSFTRLIEMLECKYRNQNGLLLIKSLQEKEYYNNYILLSQWANISDYNECIKQQDIIFLDNKINNIIINPNERTRIFKSINEDIFLL